MEKYFTVIARFAIQVENQTKGLQRYEDRFLMTKAASGEEAEEKLKKTFSEYEEPYENIHGHQVRWKFEAFIDWYETNYTSIEEMVNDEKDGEGIEVFSTLKNRRINEDRIWRKGF